MCIWLSTAVHHKHIIWQLSQHTQPCEKANSCFAILSYGPRHKQKYRQRKYIYWNILAALMSNSLRERSGSMRVGVQGCIYVCTVLTQHKGDVGGVQDRCWASEVTSTDMLPLRCSNHKRRRKKRQKLWGVKKKKAPVFSQALLTDTKSVFVCLPGCQIKEFLCVGGSDRVYLTLQLLLWSKCPTVNAGHESHLALDRGSLFSGERGSCLEKIFNGGGVWGVLS